jgi:hypothetical protein
VPCGVSRRLVARHVLGARADPRIGILLQCGRDLVADVRDVLDGLERCEPHPPLMGSVECGGDEHIEGVRCRRRGRCVDQRAERRDSRHRNVAPFENRLARHRDGPAIAGHVECAQHRHFQFPAGRGSIGVHETVHRPCSNHSEPRDGGFTAHVIVAAERLNQLPNVGGRRRLDDHN